MNIKILSIDLLRYSLFLLIFSIPFSVATFNKALILSVLAILFFYFTRKQSISFILKKNYVIFSFLLSVPFLIFFASSIYTPLEDLNIKSLMASSGFFLFPILVYLFYNAQVITFRVIRDSFATSSVLLSLAMIFTALFRNFVFKDTGNFRNWGARESLTFSEQYADSLINWNYFLYNNYATPIDIHPTYVSVFIIFSLIFIWDRISFNFYKIFVSSFLALNIALLSSRIAIVVFFIVILLSLLRFLYRSNLSRIQLFLIAFSFLTIMIFTIRIPGVKFRFAYFMTFTEMNQKINSESVNEANLVSNGFLHRFYIWKTSYELSKQKPIFGFGLGPDAKLLHMKFHEDGYSSWYNTHNQFLKFLLVGGWVGILSFLFSFLFLLFFLYKNSTKGFLSVLIFMTFFFVFLVENFLSRQIGVVLYSLVPMFLYSINTKEVLAMEN